jgi:hypothetical protein
MDNNVRTGLDWSKTGLRLVLTGLFLKKDQSCSLKRSGSGLFDIWDTVGLVQSQSFLKRQKNRTGPDLECLRPTREAANIASNILLAGRRSAFGTCSASQKA